MYKRLLGDDHPDVANSLNNLALLYQAQGRYSEAELLAVQTLQIRVAQGNYADIEPMFLQALSIFVDSVGSEHPHTIETINRLGRFISTLMGAGQTDILSDHPITQALLQQLQQG